MEELIHRDSIYRGRVLNFHVDTVRLPDGSQAIREIVEHPGAVVIAAIDPGFDVLMVRQYRSAVGRDLLELPAGTMEKAEAPDQAAERELKEETGYAARAWEPLATFFSSPGILSEEMHLFLARELEKGEQQPMADEELELVKIPLSQAVGLIREGGIVDAKSIIGLLLAESKVNRMTQ
jgi:ADP-ribose diphosphatase